MARIGFIGLGNMCSPIVTRLPRPRLSVAPGTPTETLAPRRETFNRNPGAIPAQFSTGGEIVIPSSSPLSRTCHEQTARITAHFRGVFRTMADRALASNQAKG